MFLAMGFDQCALKSYSDTAFRIDGTTGKGYIDPLQPSHLPFTMGIIIVVNGLSPEQTIGGSGVRSKCPIFFVHLFGQS